MTYFCFVIYPGELHRKIPKASRRVLDSQLIKHGLITKNVFDERPLKVEYQLTPLGGFLIPVIKNRAQLGEDHREKLEQFIPENAPF